MTMRAWKYVVGLLSAGLLVGQLIGPVLAADSPEGNRGAYGIRAEKSVMIPMRDGKVLSTDLYFPDGATGKLPTILVQTMYNKSNWFDPETLFGTLVKNGYVMAIQDVRGRFESEGRFSYASGRREDGYDTIEWIIRQQWSDRQVGATGCSYQGELTLVLAAANHPNLVTIQAGHASSGYYTPGRGLIAFDGGVLELAQTAGWFGSTGSHVKYDPPAWLDRREWFLSPAAQLFRQGPEVDFSKTIAPLFGTLPTATILQRAGVPPTDYEHYLSNAPDSKYFRSRNWLKPSDTFDVPALIYDSWYDYGPAEATQVFQLFSEKSTSQESRDMQFMIIGPFQHCAHDSASAQTIVGERDLGDARLAYSDLQLRWFNYWMKGDKDAIAELPRVQYYLMGKNEWKHSSTWPVPGTEHQKWFLHSGGRANSRHGDGTLSRLPPGDEPRDQFVYDPATPVPSLGGHACCTGSDTESGAYDQSSIEMRNDVLVYTSEPLDAGIEVTGPLRLVLNVDSSATDTDFTAKLVDVYPDGRAFNIQEAALRMRYRDGLDHAVMMKPGTVYTVELDLHASSNWFGAGHRVRLEVSSSNFPRWERNLNTGGDNHADTDWITAKNSVYHDNKQFSYLVLPVVTE